MLPMPSPGETLLLQKAITVRIAEYLGMESPSEKRFMLVNRSTFFLLSIIKVRNQHERSYLWKNVKAAKKQNEIVTADRVMSLLNKSKLLTKKKSVLADQVQNVEGY